MRFPPAIVLIPNRSDPTDILKILAGTLPLSADPGKVFFFIISILIQYFRHRRQQRYVASRYR